MSIGNVVKDRRHDPKIESNALRDVYIAAQRIGGSNHVRHNSLSANLRSAAGLCMCTGRATWLAASILTVVAHCRRSEYLAFKPRRVDPRRRHDHNDRRFRLAPSRLKIWLCDCQPNLQANTCAELVPTTYGRCLRKVMERVL